MTNWTVGHNMPGYMPESDVYITDDWTAARDALVWDLGRARDYDDEVGDKEGNDFWQEYEDIITELCDLVPNSEYLAYIGHLAWWLNATDEPLTRDDS